jgi:hypothetical protein
LKSERLSFQLSLDMAFPYTSRTGRRYYLHTRTKRGGGIQYYLSTQAEGSLAGAVPDGFEIYESVLGQVFLRRNQPKLIRDQEKAIVTRAVETVRSTNLYKIEVRGKVLTVFESASGFDRIGGFVPLPAKDLAAKRALEERFASYQAVLRFILMDSVARLFAPERFCFRGSIDDWISIGPPEPLSKLISKYVKHLGRDSFYDLD